MSDSLRPHRLYSPWNSPGQNTGVGSLSLLQGIFPTQESNWDLLHCRRILYQLSYQGNPDWSESKKLIKHSGFPDEIWPRKIRHDRIKVTKFTNIVWADFSKIWDGLKTRTLNQILVKLNSNSNQTEIISETEKENNWSYFHCSAI